MARDCPLFETHSVNLRWGFCPVSTHRRHRICAGTQFAAATEAAAPPSRRERKPPKSHANLTGISFLSYSLAGLLGQSIGRSSSAYETDVRLRTPSLAEYWPMRHKGGL